MIQTKPVSVTRAASVEEKMHLWWLLISAVSAQWVVNVPSPRERAVPVHWPVPGQPFHDRTALEAQPVRYGPKAYADSFRNDANYKVRFVTIIQRWNYFAFKYQTVRESWVIAPGKEEVFHPEEKSSRVLIQLAQGDEQPVLFEWCVYDVSHDWDPGSHCVSESYAPWNTRLAWENAYRYNHNYIWTSDGKLCYWWSAKPPDGVQGQLCCAHGYTSDPKYNWKATDPPSKPRFVPYPACL